MNMPQRVYSQAEATHLERQWAEQVRMKTFSTGVVGVGEFRLFGSTGDTPGTYPQLAPTAVIEELTEAEKYALYMINTVTEVAITHREQALFAVQPGQLGQRPNPEDRLSTFDPTYPAIWAIPKVVGGGGESVAYCIQCGKPLCTDCWECHNEGCILFIACEGN